LSRDREDLHAFDESAGQTVALADRSEVGEKSVALDAELARDGRDVVLLTVGDFRNDPEDATELLGGGRCHLSLA
jgi:diphthamide biosynthesis methyltransferase